MTNTNHSGAFLPNGELNRRRIEDAALKIVAPLVDNIKAAIPPPTPATSWLCQTFNALYNMGRADEFVDALKLLYALAGLTAPPDMEPFTNHPAAANCFMLACLLAVEDMTETLNPHAVD